MNAKQYGFARSCVRMRRGAGRSSSQCETCRKTQARICPTLGNNSTLASSHVFHSPTSTNSLRFTSPDPRTPRASREFNSLISLLPTYCRSVTHSVFHCLTCSLVRSLVHLKHLPSHRSTSLPRHSHHSRCQLSFTRTLP